MNDNTIITMITRVEITDKNEYYQNNTEKYQQKTQLSRNVTRSGAWLKLQTMMQASVNCSCTGPGLLSGPAKAEFGRLT